MHHFIPPYDKITCMHITSYTNPCINPIASWNTPIEQKALASLVVLRQPVLCALIDRVHLLTGMLKWYGN